MDRGAVQRRTRFDREFILWRCTVDTRMTFFGDVTESLYWAVVFTLLIYNNIIMILLYYDRELFVLRILHYSSEVV